MIRVEIGPGNVRVNGHAGSAPLGQDLVCAGASILVYALAQRLREKDILQKEWLEVGDAELRWDGDAEAELAMFRTGMELLGPEYVEVEDKRPMWSSATTGEREARM